jgi:hypothetical protein
MTPAVTLPGKQLSLARAKLLPGISATSAILCCSEKGAKNVSRSLYVRSMGFEGHTKTPSSARGDIHTEPIVLKAQNKGNNDISQTCVVLNGVTNTQAAAEDAAGTIHSISAVNLGVDFDLGAQNSAYFCPSTSAQRSEMCQLNPIARATEGQAQESKAPSTCEPKSETSKTGTKPHGGPICYPPGHDFPAQNGVTTQSS